MTPLFIMAILPTSVLGHAYIYFPTPRHGTSGSQGNAYCPHCLGSSSLPLPTCGQSKWLNFASGPVTTFTEGQRVKIQIKVTAHHKGHYLFRLCDRMINSSLGGLAGEEACLSQHVLTRVRPEEVHDDCKPNDKRGDCQPVDEANPGYWYLPPPNEGFDHTFHYKLPEGVTCERCTLQWWWKTANSCTPHPDAYRCHFAEMQRAGWDVSKWCGGACSFRGPCPAQQGPARECGEQFKNCADVRIEQDSKPQLPATPKATTPPASTSGPGTTSQPEPESESEKEEGEEETEETEGESEEEGEMEKHEVRCREAPGSDASMRFYCEKGESCAAGWPWRPCGGGLCSCSKMVETGSQTPSTKPPLTTRGPTRLPVATQQPSSRTECRANPVKIISNGVSDDSCSKCADGYRWWPCNQADFCICSNSLLSAAQTKTAEARAHRFLGLIQQTGEVQRTAFETIMSEFIEEL